MASSTLGLAEGAHELAPGVRPLLTPASALSRVVPCVPLSLDPSGSPRCGWEQGSLRTDTVFGARVWEAHGQRYVATDDTRDTAIPLPRGWGLLVGA